MLQDKMMGRFTNLVKPIVFIKLLGTNIYLKYLKSQVTFFSLCFFTYFINEHFTNAHRLVLVYD